MRVDFLLVILALVSCKDVVNENHARKDLHFKETVFLRSIYINDIEIIDHFINGGGNVNAFNDEGFCALHISAMHGYHGVVTRLLEAGAVVDARTVEHNMTALVLAAMQGRLEIVHLLLAAGADVDAASESGSALQFALIGKHWECVTVLSLAGAGDGKCCNNYAALFQRSVEIGYPELTKFLLNRKFVKVNDKLEFGESILVHVVHRNDSSLLEYLIGQGGDVNAASVNDRITPLHIAAMYGFVNIINLLLASGAKVNVPDKNSVTSLRWAVVNNHVDAATTLLLHNATVDVKLDSITSYNTLHWICSQNFVDMARVFLKFSEEIDVNRRAMSDEITALHVACVYGHFELAEILISNGALTDIPDMHGLTPIYYAVKHGHSELVNLLESFDCDHPDSEVLQKDDFTLHTSHDNEVTFVNLNLSSYNITSIMKVI